MSNMYIIGKICVNNPNAACIEASLAPDNGGCMTICREGDCVVANFKGDSIRSVIATMDDYLMNLSVSEGCVRVAEKQNKYT